MLIICIHIVIIVLSLTPSVFCIWHRHTRNCILIDILISVFSTVVGFHLIVPVNIEKFAFNHVIEFLIWLVIVSSLSIAVFILCMVNLKKKSNGISISIFSLVGTLLILTAVFENYCLLLIASVVFISLGVMRYTVFNRTRDDSAC